MTIDLDMQPDQIAELWDDFVARYEKVFEPLTNQFAGEAIDRLGLQPGARILDVGAGSGGAALAMARQGFEVTAVDLSSRMADRIRARAAEEGVRLEAMVMDAAGLEFPDGAFDAALSVFGVVLLPDPAGGLGEMRRVVRPGGRVAVVTWTEPARYELAAELRKAITAVVPDFPLPPAPFAQLRFVEEDRFRGLFKEAGFQQAVVTTVVGKLCAPSAAWLVENIAFAPGMAALVGALGHRRGAVLRDVKRRLEAGKGAGAIALEAVAFVGVARVEM